MRTWLLPIGWEWKKLDVLSTTTSGGTPSRGNPGYFSGDIPWIKSGELNDGFITNSEEHISPAAIESSNAKKIPRGTLLIAMYGATVGKLGILDIEAATNQAVCAIFPHKQLNRNFLFWFLKYYRKDLIEASFGGAQPNISQTLIRNIEVPIPFPDDYDKSLEIQNGIVLRIENASNEIAEARRLHEKIVVDTNRLMDAVLAEVFPSSEEELPEGWKLLTLPKVCFINPTRPRNLPYSDGVDTSFVPMAAVDEREGKISDLQIRSFGEIKRGYTYFEENDVLFAKITPCMENGKAAVARGLINGFGFGSTEFHVLRPMNSVHPEWINYFIRREVFRQEAKTKFRGAVGQQRVPKDFLETHLIPVPFPENPEKSLAIQQQIITRIQTTSGEVAEAQIGNTKTGTLLSQMEQSILAQAFRGEL
jgi:type I restriction enzyme, S subunit